MIYIYDFMDSINFIVMDIFNTTLKTLNKFFSLLERDYSQIGKKTIMLSMTLIYIIPYFLSSQKIRLFIYFLIIHICDQEE